MKPKLLAVSKQNSESFSARIDVTADINNRWHYHKENELIYIEKGKGTLFIGDNMVPFKEDDVVLIGSNLPHYWRFDDDYLLHKTSVCIYVIHFNADFWGDQFLAIPENASIKQLLNQAERGIQLLGNEKKKLSKLVVNLVHETKKKASPQRILLLVGLLWDLANTKVNLLVSIGFKHQIIDTEKDRLQEVYNYTFIHFKQKINLEDIALIAKVSPNSFCKHFKSRSRKTYSQFIKEIRVGHACKLLVENNLNVKEICYESGFFNFASFHKHFKSITGTSPLAYQKEFLK